MALEWTNDPVTTVPSTGYAWSGVTGAIVLQGTKSLGGSETRTIRVRISWSGESNDPGDSVLFSETEAVWDALVTAGYTVTSGGVEVTGPFGFEFEKA